MPLVSYSFKIKLLSQKMFSSKLKHDIITLGSGSKLGQNSESGSKFNVFTRRSTFTTLPNFEYYHLSQIPGWI